MVPSPLIELRGIGVRMGRTPVLRELDLSVAPGEVVGVRGSNGSGKTTLLRTVATLIKPSEGDGEVLGADLNNDDRYLVRPRIGLIGHEAALLEALSLWENTLFVARFAQKTDEEAAEALDVVGLARARHRSASDCSAGMRRRAEFARILLTEPTLLLFDEAQAGLDTEATELVEHVVKSVQAQDGAALIVSHHENRTAPFTDRVLQLNDGRLWETE